MGVDNRRPTTMPDKKTAAEREDAPLLADDAASDDEHGSGNAENQTAGQPATHGSLRDYPVRFGRWILKNRMVVAILCLLLGGFIALCVYFGGESIDNLPTRILIHDLGLTEGSDLQKPAQNRA